jgi:translation elongation factor EF-Ts
VASAIAKLGENISIKRFARFKVGEVTGTGGSDTAPVPAPVKA